MCDLAIKKSFNALFKNIIPYSFDSAFSVFMRVFLH